MSWKSAARPLALGESLVAEIESLGRVFHQFYKAVNQLYRRSVEGRAPAWVAEVLDQESRRNWWRSNGRPRCAMNCLG